MNTTEIVRSVLASVGITIPDDISDMEIVEDDIIWVDGVQNQRDH